MKDYYEILDVPLTATREEIKAQYKQLVRIYHPDRFRDSADKAYAEEKLKQINIAFQVLCGVPMQPTMEGAPVAPQPVAYPPVLDFGTVPMGATHTLLLQVGNLGGAAATVQLRCPGAPQAVRMSKGKRIYADRPFPLTYEVTVDTHRLSPNTTLQEWIEIDLAGVITQVELRLQVSAASQARRNHSGRFALSKRWLMSALTILVLGGIVALSPAVGSLLRSYGLVPITLLARPLYHLTQHDLFFAVQEKGLSAFYISGISGEEGSEPWRLGISGRDAVGSVAGQRVAYLGLDGEVHLLDLRSGQRQGVTADGQPKRALAWSPDGTRLAYLVGAGEQSYIEVYHVATGAQAVLPGVGLTGVNHFAWAPDGQVLLFDRWQGGERRVYRISIDGTGVHPLTTFDSWGGAWSPDGQQVVVSSPQGLYQLDRNGEHLVQMNEVAGEQPSWSADGRWLAYLTSAGGVQTLWLMEVASGQATVVSRESVSYAWNPAGGQLGYVTGRAATGAADEAPLLYLWTLTPGHSPQLLAEVNDPHFHWSR